MSPVSSPPVLYNIAHTSISEHSTHYMDKYGSRKDDWVHPKMQALIPSSPPGQQSCCAPGLLAPQVCLPDVRIYYHAWPALPVFDGQTQSCSTPLSQTWPPGGYPTSPSNDLTWAIPGLWWFNNNFLTLQWHGSGMHSVEHILWILNVDLSPGLAICSSISALWCWAGPANSSSQSAMWSWE